MSVTAAKQLSIFLDNKPGVLAKLCRALAKAEISLRALSVSDSVDHAVVRMVVDKPAKARRLFEEHNLLVLANDVLAVSLPDRPGALGRVSGRLAKARLNISYLYGSGSGGDADGILYMRVEGPIKKALAALKKS